MARFLISMMRHRARQQAVRSSSSIACNFLPPTPAATATSTRTLRFHCSTQHGSCFRRFASSSSSSSSSSASNAASRTSETSTTRTRNKVKMGKNTVVRKPMEAYPLSPTKPVPSHIDRPPYADSGVVPFNHFNDQVLIHDHKSIKKMRRAAKLARNTLDLACSLANEPGITTDEIDTVVHEAIIAEGAYPSPLNYAGFPKSLCSSINEVICHGIPDSRPLSFGDVVSFDVSCYLDGVHGDNCATVIVGDHQDRDEVGKDWRGVPYLAHFDDPDDEAYFLEARRLVKTAQESLYAAIKVCRPGGDLRDVGAAIEDVSDREGFQSVRKYRGHGIGTEFHCAPFVRHYRNNDRLELRPGMIFTIEPMLTQNTTECFEWDDNWTVSTYDGGLAAQFEHTILITEGGVEILTLPGVV